MIGSDHTVEEHAMFREHAKSRSRRVRNIQTTVVEHAMFRSRATFRSRCRVRNVRITMSTITELD